MEFLSVKIGRYFGLNLVGIPSYAWGQTWHCVHSKVTLASRCSRNPLLGDQSGLTTITACKASLNPYYHSGPNWPAFAEVTNNSQVSDMSKQGS